MSQTPYEISDKAIELLNRKAIKRFQKAKSECAALKFDELNVIKVIKRLYQNLKSDNQKAFLDLAKLVYIDIYNSPAQEPDLSWLLALLDEYDPVTKYVYEHEVDRKRDYATEAIIAAPAKAEQFRKALSYWSQFTAYYADEVEWGSTIKAFKDSGVTKVVWHTEEDARVCSECAPRDGKIYDIDKIPSKPHWGCRCWLTRHTRTDKKEVKKSGKTDVTHQYKKSKAGSIRFDKGYEKNKYPDEINVAKLLKSVFGGNIRLLKDINKEHIRTADYLWRGKLWDLKTVTTEKSANAAIRKGLTQIYENPGGIILDYRGKEIDLDVLNGVIQKRLWWTEHHPTFDVIVILSDTDIRVWRYGEKK